MVDAHTGSNAQRIGQFISCLRKSRPQRRGLPEPANTARIAQQPERDKRCGHRFQEVAENDVITGRQLGGLIISSDDVFEWTIAGRCHTNFLRQLIVGFALVGVVQDGQCGKVNVQLFLGRIVDIAAGQSDNMASRLDV